MGPPSNAIPWIMQNDLTLLNVAQDQKKTILSFANLMCDVAARQGLMQVTVPDHDLVQSCKACWLWARFHSCCELKGGPFL